MPSLWTAKPCIKHWVSLARQRSQRRRTTDSRSCATSRAVALAADRRNQHGECRDVSTSRGPMSPTCFRCLRNKIWQAESQLRCSLWWAQRHSVWRPVAVTSAAWNVSRPNPLAACNRRFIKEAAIKFARPTARMGLQRTGWLTRSYRIGALRANPRRVAPRPASRTSRGALVRRQPCILAWATNKGSRKLVR